MNIVFAATALAVTLAAAPAMSAVVLDQDNLMTVDANSNGSSVGAFIDRRQAQIVRPHVTGVLNRVDLQVAKLGVGTGPIALELYYAATTADLPTATGTPTATFLASVPYPGFSTVSIDVSSANFLIHPGQKFAILLRALTPNVQSRIGWLFGSIDPDTGATLYTRSYAGGYNNLYNANLAGAWSRSGLDRGFATYVDVTGTGVPEPASWALLIAGFGLSGAAMRRRRVVAA